MKIYLIVDYRSKFYSSTRFWDASIRLNELIKLFKDRGYEINIVNFPEVIIDLKKYKNSFFLYQSSEDRGLLYKNYIEDVMLALKSAGAILIPDYNMLRAHHNKCFMELMRKLTDDKLINNLNSYIFGTYEELVNNFHFISEKKWVVKTASEAQGKSVVLAQSKFKLLGIAKRISLSFNFNDYVKIVIKHLIRGRYREYVRKSLNRRKFILQEFIDGLNGDYKVLIFGKKYYVLSRENRKNDFRASGSGLLNIHPIIPDGLLDYCHYVFDLFNVPYISLDVAFKNEKFYLIEFQFLSFGTYTIDKSDGYYYYNNNKWIRNNEEPFMEREIVTSVCDYIEKINN